MRRTMNKLTQGATRLLVLALGLGLATTGWGDTELKTTVSGGSFTVNNVNAAAFDHCTQDVNSPKLTIPASTDLPLGTKVVISTISLGKRADNNSPEKTVVPDKIRISVGTEMYTSASVSEDSTDYFVSEANSSNTARKMKYSFDDAGCILTVGTSYDIALLNSSGAEISGSNVLNVRVVKNSQSLFGSSIQAIVSSNTWTPVQEITGDIIYTCTVASDGSSTWDITPPSSTTLRYWFEVAESATFNIGTLSCKQAYFNVASGKTLSLTGSVTASSGIYVYGGEIAVTTAPTFNGTVKGDGTLYYNGVRPTTTGTDVVLTNNYWHGTVRITYNYLNNATSTARALYPQHWGSENSKIKWNGVAGYFGGCTSKAGWILEDLTVDATTYPALRKNDGGSSSITTAPSLEGSGEFTDVSNPSERFQFKTGADFSGKITIDRTAGNGMNVQFGATAVNKVARTIHILSGASVTVASGKTWRADGGIVVSGTLTLADSTSTLTGSVTGSGTIVGGGTENVPNIASLTQSGWTGTVEVSGVADQQYMTGSASTQFMNSGSALNVTSGHLGLTGITSLPGMVSVASGATLYLASESLTDLTLNYGTVEGQINLNMSSKLENLTLNMGSARSVTGTLVTGLSSATIALKEIPSEGGTISFDAAGLPGAITSVSYTLTYADGTVLTPTSTSTVGSVTTFTYTPHISGVATDIDWDFTDGTDDALEQAPSGVSKNSDSTMTFYVDAEDSTYTGVYLKHHPYVEGAATFIHNNSSAITVAAVGTMPSGSKNIFMNFGSAYANKYGLLLANTEVANEVLVAYNYGATVTPITTMTVPNATTARHSYIITKEDSDSSTTFTVYLDGIKWKTVTTNFKIEFSNDKTGIQFGSDFGGNIRTAGYPAVSDDTGILNVLRVYGRVITPAEIATYASTFPYVSPNGSASRTFAAAAENWIDTTEASEVWDNSGEADSGTPTAGAALTVTATADTTITVNLAAETQYEALTINGSSVKFQPSSGLVKVSGMTVIGTAVTNVYGAVDMSGGPMTITEDGSICFDYSGYDASGIYSTTDATTDIPLTSDVDRNDAKVHLIAPATPYRTYSLVYESGHYAMRVTPDHEAGSEVYFGSGYLDGAMTGSGGTGTVYLETDHTHQTALFPGDTMVIDNNSSLYQDQVWVSDTFIGNIKVTRTTPMALHNGELTNPILASKTIAVEEGASLTISKHTSNALTLGALAINGAGAVALSGPLTLGGAVAGTATVTVNGSVSVSSGGSIANTVSGSGTITYAALPAAVPAGFTSWTGTVVLPTVTSGAAPLNLNSYGAVGSTVEVSGVSGSAYLANAAVTPTVHLVGDMTLSAFSATFANTFNKLSGSRAFSLTADGTAQEYADGYFLIKDVSDFTGSITVAAPGLALGGTSKPSSSEWYGKIVVQEPVTVGSGATWSASGVVLSSTTATLTVPDGATVPAVATGVAGYKVDADTTTTPGSTVYSLVAKGATVSDVAFDYGKDFATATVTATVSGDATAYTLTVGGTDYAGTVDGTTVTFSNVVTGHSSAYDSVSYEITATDGTSSVVVSGGSGAAPVADVTADWINERAASATGTSASAEGAGGTWTNAVTYTDGKAAISDNRFAATTASTASRVVLEFEVCFSSTSEDDVSGEAQAAIKLGAVNDATTFMVLTTGNTWTPVSNAELPIDASATYDVVLAIDYGTSTYKVDVEGKSLTNSAGVASFSLATNKAAVQNIDFVGSGTLTSMKGDQLEGYMVVDKNGTRYPTIDAAIAAYNANPTIGPLKVLHAGTAPSGWSIVSQGGIDILKKLAKGFFFMAY